MDTIKLPVTITEDRRLVVDMQLPPDTPTGDFEAEMMLKPADKHNEPQEITREILRERLLRGNFLVTDYDVPDDYIPMTPEERMKMGTMPPGTRESHEIIDEERGEY